MSIYITQGKYTAQSMKGMVESPEDRFQEVKALIERAGGKLIGYYVTMGEYDFMAVFENQDAIATLSGLAVAGSSGGFTDMKTTLAFSSTDAKRAFVLANASVAKFHPPGAH